MLSINETQHGADIAEGKGNKLTRQAVTTITLLYLAYLISFADRVIFGMSLKSIKASLQFSDSQLGLLSGAAFALSYALFSPAAGWMVDKLPRKIVMSAAIAFFSTATLFTGVARSFAAMAIARVGVGVGESYIAPLAVSLIGDTVPRQRRARTFGLYLSSGAMGSLIALGLGGAVVHALSTSHELSLPIVGQLQPWQGLFVAAAVAGFVLAVVILVLFKEPTRQLEIPENLDVHSFEDSGAFIKSYWPLLFALFGGMSLFTLSAYTYNAWGIVFFERIHGWSVVRASLSSAGTTAVTTLIGCLAAGRFIEALRRRGYVDAPLRIGACAGIVFAVFGILGVLAPNGNVALACMSVATFTGYIPPVCMYAGMGDLVPASARGRIAALHILVVGVVSNALGPFLIGLFNDHLFAGYGEGAIRYSMLLVFIVAAVAGLAVTLPGLRPYRRRMKQLVA